MKKILTLITIAMLAMSACSSDDDDIKGGGDDSKTKGNSWTNPAKRTVIPADELEGKWVFAKYSYEVDATDATTKKKIINELTDPESTNDLYPKRGAMWFHTGKGEAYLDIQGMYPEGRITFNYLNNSSDEECFGDYFSNQDSIFYYHCTLHKKYAYMLKKGDRLQYHFDATRSFNANYPNGGVKKVIYHAEYARVKE